MLHAPKEFLMSLSRQLSEYIAACFTGLWIQSHEHDDALAEIAQLCQRESWRLATWDIAQGLKIPGQDTATTADAGGSDPLAAIQAVNALATPDSSALLVLMNFHRFLGSPEIVQALTVKPYERDREPLMVDWDDVDRRRGAAFPVY